MAKVGIPKSIDDGKFVKYIYANNHNVWKDGSSIGTINSIRFIEEIPKYIIFSVDPGVYNFIASKEAVSLDIDNQRIVGPKFNLLQTANTLTVSATSIIRKIKVFSTNGKMIKTIFTYSKSVGFCTRFSPGVYIVHITDIRGYSWVTQFLKRGS